MAGLSSMAWADLVWGLSMAAMALCSLRAWRRIHPEAWAPLQWGRDGRPVMRAQRNLAVSFTPLAAVVGGLILAAGARLSGDESLGWMLTRLLAPLLLVVAHQAHLGSALKTLKVEGGLR
jgi:hypothetical protein